MKDLLKIAREAGINLCMVSSSGTGKSTIVEAFAKEIGVHCETLIVSNMEATEIVGIPYINKDTNGKGSLESAKPEWLKNLEKHGGNGILFIDEVSNARPDVQTPLLSMLTARKAGVYDIPKDVQFVFAMNDSTSSVDYYGMGEALRDRLCFVEHKFGKEEFNQVFQEDKAILGLMKMVGNPKNTLKINVQDYVVESYRTYGLYVNNLLKYVSKHYKEIDLLQIKVLLEGMLFEDNVLDIVNYIEKQMIPRLQLSENKDAREAFNENIKMIHSFFDHYKGSRQIMDGYKQLSDEEKEVFDQYTQLYLNDVFEDKQLKIYLSLFEQAIIDTTYNDERSIASNYELLNPNHKQIFNHYLYHTKIESVKKSRVSETMNFFETLAKRNATYLLGDLDSNQSRVNKDVNLYTSDDLVNLIDLCDGYVPNLKPVEFGESRDILRIESILNNMKDDMQSISLYQYYLGVDQKQRERFNFFLARCFFEEKYAVWGNVTYSITSVLLFMRKIQKKNQSDMLGNYRNYITRRWKIVENKGKTRR